MRLLAVDTLWKVKFSFTKTFDKTGKYKQFVKIAYGKWSVHLFSTAYSVACGSIVICQENYKVVSNGNFLSITTSEPGLQKFMRKSPYTKELSVKDAPVCIALCRAQGSFTS